MKPSFSDSDNIFCNLMRRPLSITLAKRYGRPSWHDKYASPLSLHIVEETHKRHQENRQSLNKTSPVRVAQIMQTSHQTRHADKGREVLRKEMHRRVLEEASNRNNEGTTSKEHEGVYGVLTKC